MIRMISKDYCSLCKVMYQVVKMLLKKIIINIVLLFFYIIMLSIDVVS